MYGTVKLPINDVMNWVGGVEFVESAQNLLGQGGIPNTLIAVNGESRFFSIEHTWVEFYGDIEMSGSDRWNALDPSFKQYEFVGAVDLQTAVPFNTNSIVEIINTSAELDPQAGSIKNIDQTAIETEVENYLQVVEDYVDSQMPNATIEEIIGGKSIIERKSGTGDLTAFEAIIAQVSFSEIPENLRHKFRFELNGHLTLEMATAEIAGKSMSLSFNPASEADQAILNSFFDSDASNLNEVTKSFPVNSFSVTAEYRVNNEVVENGVPVGFGTVLNSSKGFWTPRFGWEMTDSPLIAGEYQAVGVDLHGTSASDFIGLKENLEQLQNNLNAQNLEGLNMHDVTGNITQSVLKAYFHTTDIQAALIAQVNGISYFREPSFGTFSTGLSIEYFFGQPKSAEYKGVVMDIDRLKYSSESKINCWDSWTDFNKLSGVVTSAFEHIVPEQLFSVNDHTPEGISAVKALRIAMNEGQKIYTFDANNIALLDELDISNETKTEITNAVSASQLAMVHEKTINAFGWSGEGFILMDPDSGAGAYKISGGMNGGILDTAQASYAGVVSSGGGFDKIGNFLLSAMTALIENLTGSLAEIIAAVVIAIIITWLTIILMDLLLMLVVPALITAETAATLKLIIGVVTSVASTITAIRKLNCARC